MRLVQRSQDGAHGLLKGREISRNDELDRLKVHFKVVVHQYVSHPGYRWPVDLGVPLFARLADPLRRLAEYLEVADGSRPEVFAKQRQHPGRVRNPRRFCEYTQLQVRHTRAAISQRHGFPKNRVTDQRTQ